ncbi:DUF3796 domain-containing protein [Clostridium baratii]|uniref:DUF3796 domain-containing protein n=1 Tax=Clostridium baratii TaxID=1561 RepID=UPI003D344962
MDYNKSKYIGLLGLLSLIGLKGFTANEPIYYIFFINILWFTYFYENSIVYKKIKNS